MRFSFIKLSSHRVFQHVPIYYDEAKERQQERERRIKSELGIDQEEEERSTESRIRGKMRRKIQGNFDTARKEKRKSNIRLVIILVVLFALVHYLLNTSTEWFEAIM